MSTAFQAQTQSRFYHHRVQLFFCNENPFDNACHGQKLVNYLKLTFTSTALYDLAELDSFGRYLGRILASEYQADGLGLQDVKVILKCLLAKSVDLIHTAGVDKYSVYAVGFILQDIRNSQAEVPSKSPCITRFNPSPSWRTEILKFDAMISPFPELSGIRLQEFANCL